MRRDRRPAQVLARPHVSRLPAAAGDVRSDGVLAMTPHPANFAALLARAVSEPGLVSRAYTAFHGYSIGNQLLALEQCATRSIDPGPIATFMGWKEKGRHVKKGEHAIVL